MWCNFLFTCINSGSRMAPVALIFRYCFIAKMCHTVLDNTQSVLRDMASREHCRHPQGMNFKDITKDTTQDMILDTLRYAKKCSIATVGLSVLCAVGATRRSASRRAGSTRSSNGESILAHKSPPSDLGLHRLPIPDHAHQIGTFGHRGGAL